MVSEILTWELLVTINCCDGCQNNVKKKLFSVKGVRDVTLNPDINKVIVTGYASLDTLIKCLDKINKRAKPWSGDMIEDLEIADLTNGADRAKNEQPEDGVLTTMKGLSVSALGKVAKGINSAVGFLGQQSQGSESETTQFKVSAQGGSSNRTKITSQTESVGFEVSVMGVGGKISYRKDVSYI